jgi:hypothetical protein
MKHPFPLFTFLWVMQTTPLNLADFRLPSTPMPAPSKPARVFHRGEFLKGPIPLAWLSAAAKLPGKALHVGLAIWFEHGRRKNLEFRLTASVLKRFGIARKAGYRGLDALERTRLIVAQRRHGKNPVITLSIPPEWARRGAGEKPEWSDGE